jgi:hypothetical protein
VRGILHIGIPPANPTAPNRFAVLPPHKPGEKVKAIWENDLFQEIAAVALTKNAIVVTGLNRDKKDPANVDAALCAINISDGKLLWRERLPSVPTAWGLAITPRGNEIAVTLMDGRVLAFTK